MLNAKRCDKRYREKRKRKNENVDDKHGRLFSSGKVKDFREQNEYDGSKRR
jgi:hypothetical protein